MIRVDSQVMIHSLPSASRNPLLAHVAGKLGNSEKVSTVEGLRTGSAPSCPKVPGGDSPSNTSRTTIWVDFAMRAVDHSKIHDLPDRRETALFLQAASKSVRVKLIQNGHNPARLICEKGTVSQRHASPRPGMQGDLAGVGEGRTLCHMYPVMYDCV